MKGTKKTFTKKWMDIIMGVAIIDMQLPFLLAFMDKTEIAETLGVTVVTEVIGVFLVYCAKSFFETRESEKIRIKEQELGMTNNYDNVENLSDYKEEDNIEEESDNEKA